MLYTSLCVSLGTIGAPGTIKVTGISQARPSRRVSYHRCEMHELVKLIGDTFKQSERFSRIGTVQQVHGRSCMAVIAFNQSQTSSNVPLTFHYPKQIWLLLLKAQQ